MSKAAGGEKVVDKIDFKPFVSLGLRRKSEAESWAFEETLAAVARSAAARRPATSKTAREEKQGLKLFKT